MSPECPDEKKYQIIEKIIEIIEEKCKKNTTIEGQKIITLLKVNGIRFTLEDGSWGLIRASSNTPNLVVVCESPVSKNVLKGVFKFIDDILKKFKDIGTYDQSI